MAVRQLVDAGFQVLFHSPPGVLFTFPSQYCALSVTGQYLALRGGPRMFPQGFTCPVVLWIPPCRPALRLRGSHPLRPVFPGPFRWAHRIMIAVRTPGRTRPGLGSSRSARRYSGNHFCFLFLRLLRCFSSPGSPRILMDWVCGGWGLPSRVSPFRHPRISSCAAPRGFSQLVASFVGSQCQGIRPAPFPA